MNGLLGCWLVGDNHAILLCWLWVYVVAGSTALSWQSAEE